MKILLPVDGSPHSRAAVEFFASRAHLLGSAPEVHVLNVQLPLPLSATHIVGQAAVDAYQAEGGREVLDGVRPTLDGAGLAFTTELRVGHPADEIAAAAERLEADLILMGTHGHGAFGRLLLGSVTTGVLARSRRPLLVLREAHAPAGDSLRVGVAVDGSAGGLEAVRFVAQRRAMFGPSPFLELLHVAPDLLGGAAPDLAGIAMLVPPGDLEALQARSLLEAIEPAEALLGAAGLTATAVRLTGNAGDAIAAHARDARLDLIVMGTHGRGAFKQLLLGSVATRVLAHGATPVLLVHGPLG